jgi:hypothetical protein
MAPRAARWITAQALRNQPVILDAALLVEAVEIHAEVG